MVNIWSHCRLSRVDWKMSFLPSAGEVSFGVLSSEGELANVAEMFFLRRGQVGSCGVRTGCV